MVLDMDSPLLLPNYTVKENLQHFIPDAVPMVHIIKLLWNIFYFFFQYNNQITKERNVFRLSNSIIS